MTAASQTCFESEIDKAADEERRRAKASGPTRTAQRGDGGDCTLAGAAAVAARFAPPLTATASAASPDATAGQGGGGASGPRGDSSSAIADAAAADARAIEANAPGGGSRLAVARYLYSSWHLPAELRGAQGRAALAERLRKHEVVTLKVGFDRSGRCFRVGLFYNPHHAAGNIGTSHHAWIDQ